MYYAPNLPSVGVVPKENGEAYDAIRREDFRIAHFGVGQSVDY